MRKSCIYVLLTLFFLINEAVCQRPESPSFLLGIQGGITSFRGDLATFNLGRPIRYDFDIEPTVNLGIGGFFVYHFSKGLSLRLAYMNSEIKGIREDGWVLYSFESKINDIDLGIAFGLDEIFDISSGELGLDIFEKLDVSAFISMGYSSSNPDFYDRNQYVKTLENRGFYGILGLEAQYFAGRYLFFSAGSSIRIYDTDEIDGHISGSQNDAVWYHYVGLGVQLFPEVK